MGVRILASVTAVLGAATLTLACMIALVQGYNPRCLHRFIPRAARESPSPRTSS